MGLLKHIWVLLLSFLAFWLTAPLCSHAHAYYPPTDSAPAAFRVLPTEWRDRIRVDFGDGFNPARHNFVPPFNGNTAQFFGNPKIGNPYQIDSKTFRPFFPTTDVVEDGMASWYGDEFHGRATSNGGRFNMNLVSAAHRTLPIPSVAVVINLKTGQKIKLIINDRGPFVKDRILDLSKEAAHRIGYYGVGTAPVRVIFLRDETLSLWRQMGYSLQ